MTDNTEALPPAIEVLVDAKAGTIEPVDFQWEQTVRERAKDRCDNCGGEDRTSAHMVVPAEAGGRRVPSNGILLCRPCEMAAGAVDKKTKSGERRILNFWVSRKLYDSLQTGMETRKGFSSVSALIRFLMSMYVSNEQRFDDLERYQDTGADVKINVWVDFSQYSSFKTLVDKNGLTVTDALKSLIMLYEQDGEPLVQKRD